MENQHRKITGYRDLTQADIDLMNAIKAHGQETEALIARVNTHLDAQRKAVTDERVPVGDKDRELQRIDRAEPKRWTAIARTDFQNGQMALTRAVAQPSSF